MGVMENILSTDSTNFPNDCVFKRIYDGVEFKDLLDDYITEFNLAHQTPLMYAVIKADVEAAMELIEFDAGRIDDYGKTAYDYACEKYGPESYMAMLLEQHESNAY
jgi:ankyrin repeat protein